VIRSGEFNWYVESVELRRVRRPPQLASTTEEEGTSLPTLYDPEIKPRLREFAAAHPEFKELEFCGRVGRAFTALQSAWTARDWEKARAFETDSLFQSHYYWMNEYREQKLINALEQVRVSGVVPVKLQADRFYDSLTVRVFASMVDYTKTEDGRVVSGSPRSRREFTEYWTFIRGRTAQPPKGNGETTCPSCGAQLKINMSGVCEYCGSKISSGIFDWVLSTIEQDESYVG
jgi:predicted lipid-binding transport protein (Tim44 family)